MGWNEEKESGRKSMEGQVREKKIVMIENKRKEEGIKRNGLSWKKRKEMTWYKGKSKE